MILDRGAIKLVEAIVICRAVLHQGREGASTCLTLSTQMQDTLTSVRRMPAVTKRASERCHLE